MSYLAIITFEFFLLWILARKVNAKLIANLPYWIWVLLFLPGTFIHESAHYFAAKILGVHVGEFSLRPRRMEKEIVLGSVAISKTNPIKRLIIGLAPVFAGASVLAGIVYTSVAYELYKDLIIVILLSFLVFIVANSMFSSKKDLEGAWKIVVPVVIVVSLFYYLGVRLSVDLEPQVLESAKEALKQFAYYLMVPICINLMIIGIFKFLKN